MPRATLSAAIAMPLVPLPPASAHHTWDDLVRDHGAPAPRCPWDREQTHRSLVPYLIEETYEVVDAIEGSDDGELCEELGDLLLQIVFHAQLATERGKFSIADVIDALSNKMIRRHPHVFGDQAVSSVAEVWANWEQLKAQEPAGRTAHEPARRDPEGARRACSAAQKMQEKAARVGFDWPDARRHPRQSSPRNSPSSEAARRDGDEDRIREEVGDVLFTHRQLRARARRRCRGRAARRQREVLPALRLHGAAARELQGRALGDMTLDELEELWQLAKIQAA